MKAVWTAMIFLSAGLFSCSKSNLDELISPGNHQLAGSDWKLRYTDTVWFNSTGILYTTHSISQSSSLPGSIRFNPDGSFEERYALTVQHTQTVKGQWQLRDNSRLVINLNEPPDPASNFIAAPIRISALSADSLQLTLSTQYYFVGKSAVLLLDSIQVRQTYSH